MNINAQTTICAAIGNPIKHSLSPAIHNAGYESLGLNFVFVSFHAEDVKKAIDGMRGLSIRGLSVTIPHKIAVMKYLDSVDETAKQIGAVNTIVNDNGKLTGYNTDYMGAIRALKEQTEIEGKTVVLLGAGGAARAIAFGLKEHGVNLTIVNRTLEKAKELATHTNAAFATLSFLKETKTDIIINATSIGMTPDKDALLVPSEYFHKEQVIFDIVYTPKETRLLSDAKAAGARVIYGYKMLLYQAVAQFELFTGKTAPVANMEQVLLDQLERRHHA